MSRPRRAAAPEVPDDPGPELQGEAGAPGRAERARAYARLRRRLFLVDLILAGGALTLFLASGLAVRWREALQGLLGQPLGAPAGLLQALPLLLLYVCSLTLAATLLTLPLSYYGGFLLPHRFGLSTQTRPAWAVDIAKATLLGVAQTALVAIPVYALLWLAPDWWWLWAGLVLTLFGVVLANLAPVLIVPLFYTLRPLPEGPLRERLEAPRGGVGDGGAGGVRDGPEPAHAGGERRLDGDRQHPAHRPGRHPPGGVLPQGGRRRPGPRAGAPRPR